MTSAGRPVLPYLLLYWLVSFAFIMLPRVFFFCGIVNVSQLKVSEIEELWLVVRPYIYTYRRVCVCVILR